MISETRLKEIALISSKITQRINYLPKSDQIMLTGDALRDIADALNELLTGIRQEHEAREYAEDNILCIGSNYYQRSLYIGWRILPKESRPTLKQFMEEK